MKPVLSRLILSSLLLSLLGLVSCQETRQLLPRQILEPVANLGQPQVMPIAELANPVDSVESIYIEGIVRDRAPFIDSGAYQLQDQTGQVWVVTSDPLPQSGQKLTIQAKIKSKSISLHEQLSLEVYLQEVQRLP